MGPLNNLVHFKSLWCFLFIKNWSSSHHMYTGKICNCNPISTILYYGLRTSRVGPVANRPSTNKDGGQKHLWVSYTLISKQKYQSLACHIVSQIHFDTLDGRKFFEKLSFLPWPYKSCFQIGGFLYAKSQPYFNLRRRTKFLRIFLHLKYETFLKHTICLLLTVIKLLTNKV